MAKHHYITCTGFGGTGSSVISDLMKEFENVKSCGDSYELSLAFQIDGISDLQHYIVDDFERNKVAEAIYRFRKMTGELSKEYKTVFPNFEDLISKYLQSLVDVDFMGANVFHPLRYNKFIRFFYYDLPLRVQNKILKLLPRKDSYERTPLLKKYLPIEISMGGNRFFTATKELYADILDSFDKENKYEYLCFDQLVPAYNFCRYEKYFSNIKIILVDRDPRDLYLLNELFWHEAWIPSADIECFIKWYLILRKNKEQDLKSSDSVLFLQFEDAVYKYSETIPKILDFIGLSEEQHISKKQFFNPEKSKNNTRLWLKFNVRKNEISKIEHELSQYCYPYDL